jgi:hypothetical protein
MSCALGAMLAALLAPRVVLAQNPQPTQPTQQTQTQQDAPIPSAELDSLVAPIALYPDPLLAQVLAASTYPLEIVQMQQWLAQHAELKDQALVDAVSQQKWDPSVQSMAALPDVVKLLASDIKWVTDLGNAFLAQESDVMDAVQRMRQKASGNGKLSSNEHLKVENKTEGGSNVIVIEQSDPQTVYVPSYNPTVVYGEPVASYAYPAVAYPPLGYYAAGAAISFGVGVAMGAAFHGGWGYGCGWGGAGHNDINVNRQNNFQRNSVNGINGAGGGKWQHNPQHRGGAPYGNRSTNERFGGSQRNARAGADRTGGLGGGDRGGNRAGADRGGVDRGGNRGGADRGGGNRAGGGDRGGNRGGADRVGNRSAGNRGGGGGSSALGSGNRSGGYNGQAARQSSNRGSASRGNTSRPSGGASRSGGSRSGGSRGGGGGRGGGGRGGGGRR